MRLAKEKLRENRAALEQWQKPGKMLMRARALMDIMGNADLFNQPGVDFISEAWAAAQFAKGRRALAVRLVAASEQWPDFEIRTRGQVIERWEFTEVDNPTRRRGLEMRRMQARRAAGKMVARSEPF